MGPVEEARRATAPSALPTARPAAHAMTAGTAPGDPRVALVLEVLAGTPIATAAARWSVDPALAERWVRAFVEAGTARVTNQPNADEASQRDRFLAAVAHELRSPLTVARGWVGMLTEDDGLPDMALCRLEESLDRLGERIEEIELLVAASLGRMPLRPTPLRVGDVVATLPDGPDQVGGDGPEVVLLADPHAYRRIVADLWRAADTAPAPRRRSIEVRRDGAWWALAVRREGDPIDRRRLRALFEPFDHNDDATGVTFGLYLARALTVALGGTVGVEQDEDGAVLWLRTPVAARTDEPPRPTAGGPTDRGDDSR
ncbi:MAG: sensor histidine kinase [Marmoricola sp.]